MRLAILFWFYKDLEVCRNHLEILRQHNPDVQIFGLYGGPAENADEFRAGLSQHLDDFYVSPYKQSKFKWRHGDLCLLDWFNRRGKNLSWDTIAVIQWDMLVFTSIRKLFREMKESEIFFWGFSQLDADSEAHWYWTKPNFRHRQNFLQFKQLLGQKFDYHGPIFTCLFILEALPRQFFEQYQKYTPKLPGFLEYKVPTLSQIWGIPGFKLNSIPVWPLDQNVPMQVNPDVISKETVGRELAKSDGWRIFHPYEQIWKNQADPPSP